MKNLTIMLTASGSQFAPGIIKCLKQNGERDITVIGGDMGNDPTNQYLVDKFYQIPAASDPNYAKAIAEICKKEKVDILLPQMSAELSPYLENMRLFEEIGTIVSMTRNEGVAIANNKLKLFQFMTKNEISTPQYRAVCTIDEFEKALCFLNYPDKAVCVKMTESSGSRGIRIIDANKSRYKLFAEEKPASFYITVDDMRETLLEADVFPELLLMECLEGDEYTIDLLADHGEVCYIAGRRNPVMLMSISQETILEHNEQAYEIATRIVNTLKLDGNIGMDFKFDASGCVHLLEINPRIDATVSVFAAGGLNLPYLRIKQLLGETLPEVHINYGVRLKRRYSEMFTDSEGRLVDW